MTKITYSTNMMGPWALDWYRARNLLDEDNKIITHYVSGRIDIRGLSQAKYWNGQHEYRLPVMHHEDWTRFSKWLDSLETYHLWEYDKIIYMYEDATDTKIRWANEYPIN